MFVKQKRIVFALTIALALVSFLLGRTSTNLNGLIAAGAVMFIAVVILTAFGPKMAKGMKGVLLKRYFWTVIVWMLIGWVTANANPWFAVGLVIIFAWRAKSIEKLQFAGNPLPPVEKPKAA